jgi:hypothetical protein
MTNVRSPTAERAIVFGNPEKRRYGARLVFQVLHGGFLGDMENAAILLDTGAVATLAPVRQPSWEGGRRFELKLEGFPTATVAEAQGRRLGQAILWTAISLNDGLRLSYRTQEPVAVFDRTVSEGNSMWAEATTSHNPQVVLDQFAAGFAVPQIDSRSLLSMEIFCSSSLEASDRAAFLTAVSALEPLAEERPLGAAVDTFVDGCLASLRTAHSIDQQHRASLEGRIQQLRQESIRQALRRIVTAKLPNHPTAPALADAAYALRSELIHDGRLADYDVDLATETRKISGLLRVLYARTLGLTPHAPATV